MTLSTSPAAPGSRGGTSRSGRLFVSDASLWLGSVADGDRAVQPEVTEKGGAARAQGLRPEVTPLAPRLMPPVPAAVSSPRAAQWSILGIFLLLAVFALSWASFFLVPVTVALMFGLTLGPVVEWLERHRVPSYLASALMLAMLSAVPYGLFLAFAVPLEEWSLRVPEILGEARRLLFTLRETLEKLHEIGKSVEEAARAGDKPLEVAMREQGAVSWLLSSAPAVMAQVLILVGVLYFFLANRSRLRAALLAVPRAPQSRWRIARTIRDTEYYLSRYVAAITVVNLGLGLATGIAMWAIGMPSPALWGALAAVLNFVPYLGPGLVALILAGVALVTFEQVSSVLLAPALFLVLNLLEGQFVTPAVLGRRLTLNPFVVFLSLAFWVWLWGPVGAFLAVPLLIVAAVTLHHCLSTRPRGGPAAFGKPLARKPMTELVGGAGTAGRTGR